MSYFDPFASVTAREVCLRAHASCRTPWPVLPLQASSLSCRFGTWRPWWAAAWRPASLHIDPGAWRGLRLPSSRLHHMRCFPVAPQSLSCEWTAATKKKQSNIFIKKKKVKVCFWAFVELPVGTDVVGPQGVEWVQRDILTIGELTRYRDGNLARETFGGKILNKRVNA